MTISRAKKNMSDQALSVQILQVEGMSCSGCAARIKEALFGLPGVQTVVVSHEKGQVVILQDAQVPLSEIRSAIQNAGDYSLVDRPHPDRIEPTETEAREKSKWQRLYPLFLVFLFLIGGSLLHQWSLPEPDLMVAMQVFMGSFFVVFAFFKFLDLSGFVRSFRMYDPISGLLPVYAGCIPLLNLRWESRS